MKRKIDTIKGKRLVMGGGTNLLTKDEILVTETPNGVELKERSSDGSIKEIASGSGGGGDSGSSDVEYWKINDYNSLDFNDKSIFYIMGSMFKIIDVDDFKSISGANIAFQELNNMGSVVQTLLGFMFSKTIAATPIGQITINSFVEYLELLGSQGQDRMNILEHLTPITKEEFYDLNNI